MNTRGVYNIAGLTICLALLFAFAATDSFAVSKEEIDVSVKASLDRFDKQVKGAKEFREISKGMLVIPNVTKAAFIVGGQYGQGALQEGGKTVGYYSLAAGSLGYQIGAEKFDLLIIFATDEAMKKFRNSEGWEAGVDAEVTLIDAGIDVPASTLISQHPVVGFVYGQKGLMAGVSVKGAKFTKINPD
ncbi:MAG: YSC84-related protein [Thermodesulfovibrionales bacterium]